MIIPEHSPDARFGHEDITESPVCTYKQDEDIQLPSEPTFVDIVQIDLSTSSERFRRWQQIRDNIEKGVLPPLGNGFTYAIDDCPGGHVDTEYRIPAMEFTKYFSDDRVPMAAVGHPQHNHDVGHVEGYQEMFRHNTIAELVRSSSKNATATYAESVKFATAVDRLSEIVNDLMQGKGRTGDIGSASIQISSLISLRNTRPYDINNIEDKELHSIIRGLLRLDYHEAHLNIRETQEALRLQALGGGTVNTSHYLHHFRPHSENELFGYTK